MILDLRNPCLKARHWEVLETVVEASLTDEPLCLATLERLNVFSYGEEIQEVTDGRTHTRRHTHTRTHARTLTRMHERTNARGHARTH